jgi:hypothetical protein
MTNITDNGNIFILKCQFLLRDDETVMHILLYLFPIGIQNKYPAWLHVRAR